jgi:hypothetical protein
MKKVTTGIFIFSIVAILGIGFVASFPFGNGQINQNLSDEEQSEMIAFHNSVQNAIENNDFDGWKSLMESRLTEENFNRIVEMHKERETNREEMQQFCGDNGCSNFGEGNFGMHRGMMRNYQGALN